jgi:hypothetical protein
MSTIKRPLYVAIQGAAKTGVLAVCEASGHILEIVEAPPLTMRVNPNVNEDLEIGLKT